MMQTLTVSRQRKTSPVATVVTLSARPRVLHLLTSFDIGGTERQAIELLRRLPPERFDLRLAVLRSGGPLQAQIADRFPQVPAFPLTSFGNAQALRQLWRLTRLIRRERVDLLHTHDFYTGIFGGAAARLTGVKIIGSQRHLRLSERRAHRWGQRLIHLLSHRLLVNSEAIRQQVVREGVIAPERIVLIRNGLLLPGEAENNDLRDVLHRELSLPNNAFLVGVVARLEPVKGHQYLIAAAARVIRLYPHMHFILVGDGTCRNDLIRQAAALGIADHVHLPGFHADGARLAGAFDLSVLPSLHEGFPNAVMEAMAAGVPVIATDVGGTRELIVHGETGWLVPPANVDALVAALLFARKNQQQGCAIALQAKHFITTQMSMPRAAAAVEKLYDEMLTGSGISRRSR